MPARIVVVHDHTDLADRIANGLRASGYEASSFADPMAALTALETPEPIAVLVTRVRYPTGKPNGIALALMARRKRPDMRVLFVALPEYELNAAGLGEFISMPVEVSDVVAAVDRMLMSDGSHGPPEAA